MAEDRAFTEAEIESAVRAYAAGDSLERVAQMLGVAMMTARTLLVDNYVTIRGRGRPRKN